jgi:hypothetical protein
MQCASFDEDEDKSFIIIQALEFFKFVRQVMPGEMNSKCLTCALLFLQRRILLQMLSFSAQDALSQTAAASNCESSDPRAASCESTFIFGYSTSQVHWLAAFCMV